MSEKKNAAVEARDDLSEKRASYDGEKPVDKGGHFVPFEAEVKSTDGGKGKLTFTGDAGFVEVKCSGSVVLDRDGVAALAREVRDLESAL